MRASDPPGGPLAEDYQDWIYECVTAGATDAVQPAYDTMIGQDTSDGTAVFRARDAFTRAAEVDTVDSNRSFVLTDALGAYPDGWFDEGLLVWETGANTGVGYEVKSWTRATRTLTFVAAARLPALAGDRLRVASG